MSCLGKLHESAVDAGLAGLALGHCLMLFQSRMAGPNLAFGEVQCLVKFGSHKAVLN